MVVVVREEGTCKSDLIGIEDVWRGWVGMYDGHGSCNPISATCRVGGVPTSATSRTTKSSGSCLSVPTNSKRGKSRGDDDDDSSPL